jgi:hypothetical protein
MAQVAGKGALIGGGIRLAFKLYEKYKQGKNPFRGDFTADDWKVDSIVLRLTQLSHAIATL